MFCSSNQILWLLVPIYPDLNSLDKSKALERSPFQAVESMFLIWSDLKSILKKKYDRINPLSNLKQIYQENLEGIVRKLKVNQFRKQIVKPWILPKNERMNLPLLLWDVFLFIFWKKLKSTKRHFEINWPLKHNNWEL